MIDVHIMQVHILHRILSTTIVHEVASTFEHALLLEPGAVGHCLDFVSSLIPKEACEHVSRCS